MTLRDEYIVQGRFSSFGVIDIHGHSGSFSGIFMPLAHPDRMAEELERRGISLLLFCPHITLFDPGTGNRAAVEIVRRHPDRMRAYWGVIPDYADPERDLKEFEKHPDIFVGFKFLAPYHNRPMTDGRYRPFWEYAHQKRLPVLAHTWGGAPTCGERIVRECAARYPHIPFILGHSLHSAWEESVAVAKEFPNTYLDLCAVLDDRGILELFVGEGLEDRILFGTDFPWFGYPAYIGAVLGADITDEARRKILFENARRLLAALPPERRPSG